MNAAVFVMPEALSPREVARATMRMTEALRRFLGERAARAKYLRMQEEAEVCSACDGEGIQLRYETGPLFGVVTPCSRCQEQEFLSFVSRYAYNLALREQAEDEREQQTATGPQLPVSPRVSGHPTAEKPGCFEPEPSTLRSSEVAGGVNPAAVANSCHTEPAGETDALAGSAASGDPWDLASEEEAEGPRAIRATALELAKADGWRPPSQWKDRGEYDPHDDRSDIDKFGRLEKHPWGGGR